GAMGLPSGHSAFDAGSLAGAPDVSLAGFRLLEAPMARVKTVLLCWSSLILLTGCGIAQPISPSSNARPSELAAKKRLVAAVSAEPTTLSDTLNAATPGGSAGAPEIELLVH